MVKTTWFLAVFVAGLLLATPPIPPAPRLAPAPTDGEWVEQPAGGPAFRWRADSAVWNDPGQSPQVWPSLYQPGTLWDYDPGKQALWANATAWGRPTWSVSRIPSTPTFPAGWLPVGCVAWDGSTYRMRLAGGTATDVPTVDLRTGAVSGMLAEREVRAVVVRIGLQLPAD